jgi:uncharacterized protein (DUF488 family)
MIADAGTIWTVGHSNVGLDTFLATVADIDLLADVRSFPHSPRFPYFDGEALQRTKPYRWYPALGGRRHDAGNRHVGWRVASFRAYAAYMETEPFRQALSDLEGEARRKRTAMMCAELLWWRCHRRLISDVLVVRGWRVIHLPGGEAHELCPFARVESDGTVVYDRELGPAR